MTEPARTASKISLVLADVDGTLVTKEKVLTPRAAAAVKALRSAGIAFAITSGRPPRGMAMLIEPLALELLQRVETSPRTTTQLAAELVGAFANEPEAKVVEFIEVTLLHLQDVGLVISTPIETF